MTKPNAFSTMMWQLLCNLSCTQKLIFH